MFFRTSTRALLLHFGFAGWLAVAMATSADADSTRRLLLLSDSAVWDSQLASLEEGKARFVGEADERSYATGQWCRWGHPVAPAMRPQVMARDGSIYVSRPEWSARIPLRVDEKEVVVDHSLFGPVRLPRCDVKLVVLQGASEPDLIAKIEKEIDSTSLQQDRVWLVSGDAFSGDAVSFDSTLRFRLAGQELVLAANDIAAFYLHSPLEVDPLRRPAYTLGLNDGTLISAILLAISAEGLTVTTPGGTTLSSKTADQVVFVQTTKSYLSDHPPIDYQHTPYFELPRSLATDRNLNSEWASVEGHHYLKCLAMPTAARAVYRVPTGATHFAAHVAIDDSSDDKGSAIFRVYRVAGQTPELIYESPIVRGGDSPRPVHVPLEGAQVVLLVVDFADYGDQRDHCLWLDPRWIEAQPDQGP